MAVKHHKLHSKFSCFQTPLIDFLCLGGWGGRGGGMLKSIWKKGEAGSSNP